MPAKISSPRDPRVQSLIGRKFNRLTAVRFLKMGHGQIWEFGCVCGGTKIASLKNVKKGLTGSCGCLHREMLLARNHVHGHASRSDQHPIYKVWLSMRNRCADKNDKNYGGRGISVCSRWDRFQNFFDDMAETYRPRLMIERVDNNKGYSKSNCVWATRGAQNRNKRNVHPVTFDGETMTLAEWGRKLSGGRNSDLIYTRVRRGWSIDRALRTSV